MARGAPDYWSATIASKSIFSPDQTLWYNFATSEVDWNEENVLIDYSVPADTILTISTGYIMSEQPMTSRCLIKIDTVTVHYVYFSINYNFPFNPNGIFELTEGQRLQLNAINHDDETLLFTASLIGFEQEATQ